MDYFENIGQYVPEGWVGNWENTIEERINKWRSQFDEPTQKKLDFSPESLMVAEQKLIEKIEKPYPLFLPENFYFLDGVNTYIGEVYIRNDKVRSLYWVCSKNKDEYYLAAVDCDLYANSSVSPSDGFMYAILKKEGDSFYKGFLKNTNYFIENQESLRRNEEDNVIQLEGTFDTSYDHFILLKNDDFKFDSLKGILDSVFTPLKVKYAIRQPSEHILYLKLKDKYLFQFHFNGESHVLDESKEFAENFEFKSWSPKTKEEIAQCASRIEFWGDEDNDGDYINEYMFIFDELVKHPSLLIYDTNQGLFYDEI